eukprot:m51a1_g2646 hypothetical protein (379) ;mRNA; f:611042-612333
MMKTAVVALLLCAAIVQAKTISGRYVSVAIGDSVYDVTKFGARRTFLFKTVTIKGDHTELKIDGTLVISGDHAHWPSSAKAAISITAKSNVAITGSGTIDGQGASWWANLRNKARPRTIYPHNVNTMIVSGITVKDCPYHCLQMYSSNTEIFGITLRTPPSTGIAKPSHNTDGIDIHGDNFWVHNCDISVGDDNVAIHSSRVLVEDCQFGTGHGASIGSLCSERISDITVKNVHFTGTTAGARIKTVPGCPGSLSNVWFRDLILKDVKKTIELGMFYKLSEAKPSTHGTFKISNINYVNIQSTNSGAAGEFLCDPKSPCGINMHDVVISGKSKSLAYKCSHVVGKATGQESPRPCVAHGAARGIESNYTDDAVDVQNN